jgi:hypothetical protein
MSFPTIIGLHGYKHAGKDTVFGRIAVLGGERFVQFSIADPMKDSISALFDIPLDVLDELKNDPLSHVTVTRGDYTRVMGFDNRDHPIQVAKLTMRRFMERYGTQAHRDQFGDDFWLTHWSRRVEDLRYGPDVDPEMRPTVVNTSVRFPNEAHAILAQPGGEIWLVVGTDEVEEAGRNARDENGEPIPSELRLPDHLITRTIDNSIRETWEHQISTGIGTIETLDSGPDFSHLDDQIAPILSEWRA